MSRSYLRDKRALDGWHFSEPLGRNPHKRDEMPKNSVSKYVATHCHANVSWVEDKPTHCSSHKRRKGAHRIISGLVRASVKRETQRDVEQQINEDMNNQNFKVS